MDEEKVINSYLDDFKNDLWIERRLELDQLIEYLQQLAVVKQTAADSSIDDLIDFFKFLKEQCSGFNFNNDKQWSELMNLMQISRKLNHRSVKVKDIVKNKQFIEANADNIKRFNEKTKLSHNIGLMLDELDLMMQKCSLELPNTLLKEDNDDDCLFVSSQVLQTKTYLQDRCKPLLYTLKLEIDNELIREEGDLEKWSLKIQDLDSILAKLENFANNLYELQSKLLNLKPLMSIDHHQENLVDKKDEKELTNSLNLCKVKFKSIQGTNSKLLESLCNFRDKIRSATNSKKNKLLSSSKDNSRLMIVNLLSTSKSDTRKFIDDLYDSKLTKALIDLDQCRKDLDKIMMNLRIEFGRFYFVNDIELLTIISLDSKLIIESSNENMDKKGKKFASDSNKQSLISKLFNNSINGFLLKDNKFIVGVRSPLNEVIEIYDEPIPIKKKVNIYSTEIVRILNECSRKLRKTLRAMLMKSLDDPNKESEIDSSLPVQLINLAEQVKFCKKVEAELEDPIDANSMFDSLLKFYENRFRLLCDSKASVDPMISGSVEGDCLDKLKKSAAISLTVQHISIIMKLKSSKVYSKSDWNWIKQVRYYLRQVKTQEENDEGHIEVEIVNARFKYRFDYLPIQVDNIESTTNRTFKRLISTQITDRCVHVASQAISNYRLGANPYGPAGSGKTETIKALGHSLGCQVIVHNCTESNDSGSLEKLIFGLAHTGLWGCFDEFNRLSSSVLSTVSASLELVQTNLRENKLTVELLNGEQMMSIDQDSAFFVTLNPGDETKYRGRRKLPSNLRNLFLPISMIRVEIDSIVSENLLIICGELNMFAASNRNSNGGEKNEKKLSEMLLELGHKFNLLIVWMRENIKETSNRCEWDLRFVMAVLRRLKTLANNKNESSNIEQLLLKSVMVELRPRLTTQEVDLFYTGVEKVFDGLDKNSLISSNIIKSKLLESVQAEMDEISYENSKKLAKFVQNLQEQLTTRTGVMLLGESRVGKSTIWRLSQRILGDSKVKWMAINPRSCQKKELFGYVDPSSNKWIDGLLTIKVKEAVSILQQTNDNSTEQVWIILDGPVDPDWIESLNSVMDDNQVLTLSSGERLDFQLASGKSIKLIFETTSIDFASPATMSRLGLLYIERGLIDTCGERNDTYLKQFEIFNNQAVAENNAQILAKSDLFEGFKTSQDSKLLIVSGSANQTTKLKFIENNINKSEIVDYCCSEFTNSTHLQDLLTKSRNNRYLLIRNAQKTFNEDRQWKTSTFLELLRFMITYEGYYDSEFSFKPLKHKFILFLEDLNDLSPRVLALSNAILVNGEKELDEIELINSNFEQFISSNISPKSYSKVPIFTLLMGSHFEILERELILSKLEDARLFEFSNSRSVDDSLEALRQLLMDNPTQKVIREARLFILRELEFSLLDRKLKGELFHLLNKLRTSELKLKVRFLYIASNYMEKKQFYGFEFFSSIGPIYELKDENKPKSVNEFLSDKLNREVDGKNILNFDQNQKVWITKKLSDLFEQFQENNFGKIGNFIKFFMALIERLKCDLTSERKTLANGLGSLNQFEQVVNNIKSKCQVEEIRLIEKKNEIDRLLQLIDTELKKAHKQREHIEDLKSKQVIKTKKFNENNERVKQNLSKVEPLIETSKIEVAKYLKPEALNEIKSLRSPPKTIKDILDVLFVLLGIKDSSWSSIKAHLTKYSIKDELTNYDFTKNLNKSLILEIETIIKSKPESFNKQQAERASKAILPILGWIEATLEYGKVLISLQPSNEELAKLKEEFELLNKEAQKVEVETVEVDEKIQEYSKKLDKLKLELKESQQKADIINEQLMEAQKVRIEMKDRIDKWRLKLTSLEIFLNGEQLIQLCLIASAVVFNYYKSNFEELFKLFELENFKLEKFLATFLNLIEKGDREFNEFSFKPEQTIKIMQLLVIKLCLADQSTTISEGIPFIDVGSHQDNQTSMEKLVQFLSFDEILTDSRQITILKFQDNDWLQSIELLRRLNKIIIVDMRNKPPPFHLDVIDYLAKKSLYHGSKLECILIGNLKGELCQAYKHMLCPIRLDELDTVSDESEDCSIKSTILDSLIKFYDPGLSKSFEQLEYELSKKQMATKLMEKDLLKQLAGIQIVSDTSGGGETVIHDDLVKILSELYQLSSSLEKDIDKMRINLDELKKRQHHYFEQADKAANFYKRFIADLYKMDNFYHISLAKFIELLLFKLNGNNKHDCNNYEFIINQVMLSMHCEDRVVFGNELKQVVDVNGMKVLQSSQLKNVISELLLDETSTNTNTTNILTAPFTYKLAVVMHDVTKSSPQAEIDELFRLELRCCSYSKVYATGESSPEHLESAIRKLSTSYNDDSTSYVVEERRKQKDGNNNVNSAIIVKCLCIANAHLSAEWLNLNLLRLLEKESTTTTTLANSSTIQRTKSKVLALVILVGEKEVKGKLFSEDILDCAKIKYWHDELALNLLNRYKQYSRSIFIANKGSFLNEQTLEILAKELILFHVVCQELTKRPSKNDVIKQDDSIGNKHLKSCWKNRQSYSFDYEQLGLAFKTLKLLWEQTTSQHRSNNNNYTSRKSINLDIYQFRLIFCDYLKYIVYGSRMESLEDESQLNRLIERFLSSPKSAKDQLNKLEQFEFTSGSVIEYDRLLADLIDE